MAPRRPLRAKDQQQRAPTHFRHLPHAIANGKIGAAEAVKAYHGELEKLKIKPYRPLKEDLELTTTATSYAGTGSTVSLAGNAKKRRPSVTTAAKSTSWRRQPRISDARGRFDRFQENDAGSESLLLQAADRRRPNQGERSGQWPLNAMNPSGGGHGTVRARNRVLLRLSRFSKGNELIAERQSRLKELLGRRGMCDLDTLAAALNVSQSTVRRDVEMLEQSGLVERTHGGVIWLGERNSSRPPLCLRSANALSHRRQAADRPRCQGPRRAGRDDPRRWWHHHPLFRAGAHRSSDAGGDQFASDRGPFHQR